MSETYSENLIIDEASAPPAEHAPDARDAAEASEAPGGARRSNKIKAILAQRVPYLERVLALKAQMTGLLAVLQKLNQRAPEMLGIADAGPSFEALGEIDFGRLIEQTEAQLDILDKLESRFGRKTLNVAVVGMARQGKSFLLRRMSGLGVDVIPDRSGKVCTGVRSTVLHSADGVTRGEVFYHTPDSLLQIIHKYWETLGLADPPPSIEAFLARGLPVLPAEKAEDVLLEELHKELYKYHANLEPLRPKLGGREPITREQIAGYVTQPESPRGPLDYVYLVVREVQIFCPFPLDEVEGVGLIDLPGLGEATLGGPERVVQTLELDADVALFVWRPKKDDYVGREILRLYNMGYGALRNSLTLDRWSFLVINEDLSMANSESCARMEKDVRLTGMGFFGVAICDCSDAAQVRGRVLEPVLDYMAAEISNLDRDFARSSAESIRRLREEVSKALQSARLTLEASGETLEARRFYECFDEMWVRLAAALNEQVGLLEIGSTDSDEQLSSLVESTVREYEQSRWMPKLEEIDTYIRAHNGYGGAYDLFRNQLRADLSARLRRLDSGLDQSLEAVKRDIASIFIEEGRFGHLLNGERSLAALTEKIPPSFSAIKEAFRYLDSFRLSARGVIGFKVRSALGRLEPLLAEMPKADDFSAQRLAQDVQRLVAEAVQVMRETLAQEEYRRPKECAFAIVADFRDAVIFSRGIENEWRLFYESVKAEVWPEKFRDMYELRRRRAEMLDLIGQAQRITQNDLLAGVV